jgi:hypothetical protein
VQQQFLVPPSNFACIDRGIYRASFPKKKNFAFLKRLGLKTIVFLCPEEYPAANLEFLESIGARLLTFGVEGNKARECECGPLDIRKRPNLSNTSDESGLKFDALLRLFWAHPIFRIPSDRHTKIECLLVHVSLASAGAVH